MSDYIPFSENTVPIGPSCSLQALGYKQEGKGNKNVVHLHKNFFVQFWLPLLSRNT